MKWLLYVSTAMMVLVVVSKATAPWNPMIDPANPNAKSVWFWASEMNGKECKDMAEEAAKLGATRWACPVAAP